MKKFDALKDDILNRSPCTATILLLATPSLEADQILVLVSAQHRFQKSLSTT